MITVIVFVVVKIKNNCFYGFLLIFIYNKVLGSIFFRKFAPDFNPFLKGFLKGEEYLSDYVTRVQYVTDKEFGQVLYCLHVL